MHSQIELEFSLTAGVKESQGINMSESSFTSGKMKGEDKFEGIWLIVDYQVPVFSKMTSNNEIKSKHFLLVKSSIENKSNRQYSWFNSFYT